MLRKLAILCVHTSPLAALGVEKAGDMNVYIREIAQEFGRQGLGVDIFTRRISSTQPDTDEQLGNNVRVIHVSAGPTRPLNPLET